jgi:hypothetical protein
MRITMQRAKDLTLEAMRGFLEGSEDVEFQAEGASEVYPWVGEVLAGRSYDRLGKADRGLVKRFLEKITGRSRAQLTRLIGRWRREGQLRPRRGKRRRFPRTYTEEDIRLLARLDEAHEGLGGPATKRILEREFTVYGKPEYKRLAGISASHIYNLRRGHCYRRMSSVRTKTQAAQVAIGERRKPDPRDRPGWLRVDTVHQGDRSDGTKGLYHLNAVDTVTQWQVVGAVETISDTHLLPVLEAMLHQFPFRIHGFHADNGGEFINHQVATMLNRLLVTDFTKSRANRTTDNALVEGKNGAIVRKQIGYGWIAQRHAEGFERFYRRWLNPYLNFHRPCGFAQLVCGKRGRLKRLYRQQDYVTPYEKLRSLAGWEKCLKEGIRPEQLERRALEQSDTESAQAMQIAKQKMLAAARSAASLPPGKSA